jgi:hypothetical protein
MRRVDFYVTDGQFTRLQKIMKEKEFTFSELMRRMIDKYLEEGKKERK